MLNGLHRTVSAGNHGPRTRGIGRWLPWVVWGGIPAALALIVGSRELAAERAARPMTDPGGLWISEGPLDESRRLMIVVDPSSRHAAIYHVDAATGALVLRSTRDITWDLMVDDFNAQEPRPASLRRLLQAGPGATPEAVQPGVSPGR
jgi:hypothetical protein